MPSITETMSRVELASAINKRLFVSPPDIHTPLTNKPALTTGGEPLFSHSPSSSTTLRAAINELEEEDYVELLQHVCADNLRGWSCRASTRAGHRDNSVHICKDFRLGVCMSYLDFYDMLLILHRLVQ